MWCLNLTGLHCSDTKNNNLDTVCFFCIKTISTVPNLWSRDPQGSIITYEWTCNSQLDQSVVNVGNCKSVVGFCYKYGDKTQNDVYFVNNY